MIFGTNWIGPAHDGNKWQPVVNAVMNFMGPKNVRNS